MATPGWVCSAHQEGHLPDMSDCPDAKRSRGQPDLRIGDIGPMGRILIPGEAGHAIVPELTPIDGEIIIDKPGKGAFYATALDDFLQAPGITHLLFTGVTTEVCVQTTMREANDRGYVCLLVEDADRQLLSSFQASDVGDGASFRVRLGWTAASTEDLYQHFILTLPKIDQMKTKKTAIEEVTELFYLFI